MAFGTTNISMFTMADICYNNPGITLDMNNAYVRMMCQAATTGAVSLSGAFNRPPASSSSNLVAGSYTFYSPYVWQFLQVEMCGGTGGGAGCNGEGGAGTAGGTGGNSIFYSTNNLIGYGGGGGQPTPRINPTPSPPNTGAAGSDGSWSGSPAWDGIQGAYSNGLWGTGGSGGTSIYGNGGNGGRGGRAVCKWLHAKTSGFPEWNTNYNYVVGAGGPAGTNGSFPPTNRTNPTAGQAGAAYFSWG